VSANIFSTTIIIADVMHSRARISLVVENKFNDTESVFEIGLSVHNAILFV
jgi:hypothetical protein